MRLVDRRHNATDNCIEGALVVAVGGEVIQGVMRKPTWSAMCMGRRQDHIFRTIQVAEACLQLPQHCLLYALEYHAQIVVDENHALAAGLIHYDESSCPLPHVDAGCNLRGRAITHHAYLRRLAGDVRHAAPDQERICVCCTTNQNCAQRRSQAHEPNRIRHDVPFKVDQQTVLQWA